MPAQPTTDTDVLVIGVEPARVVGTVTRAQAT